MEMMAAYIWYLVVAGPGGGMAVMPSAFESRAECQAAVEEYRRGPADAGWSLQCIPSAANLFEEQFSDEMPAPR